jgi:hypothetical protein
MVRNCSALDALQGAGCSHRPPPVVKSLLNNQMPRAGRERSGGVSRRPLTFANRAGWRLRTHGAR